MNNKIIVDDCEGNRGATFYDSNLLWHYDPSTPGIYERQPRWIPRIIMLLSIKRQNSNWTFKIVCIIMWKSPSRLKKVTNIILLMLTIADIDDCEGNTACDPNGVCQDGINEFTCDCSPGWQGPTCDVSKYVCGLSLWAHEDPECM